jgi:hypothetical protein
MVEEQKSIGQVLYETMYHGHYPALGLMEREQWEARAQAVRTAVLAEQAEPQGPGGMAEQELRVRQAVVEAISTMLGNAFEVRLARVLTVAIEEGVLVGLKAWEAYR